MGDGRVLSRFGTGEIYTLVSVLSILCLCGLMSLLSALVLIFPLASKMKNYEDEMMKLHNEKKQYAEAKAKLISAALKFENTTQ